MTTQRIIKREMTKDWSKAKIAADLSIHPDDIVSIQRPGPWGNPWKVGTDGSAEYCTMQFERWLKGFAPWPGSLFTETYRNGMTYDREAETQARRWILDNAPTLRGKVFMCWCADWSGESPAPDCHGVPLWRYVNEATP